MCDPTRVAPSVLSGEDGAISRRSVLIALGGLAAVGVGGASWFTATRYGAAAPPHEGVLALTGGRVLSGTGLEPLDRATVVIRDGTIVAVGADAEVQVPVGARTVDLAGRTLLPGLIDLHVHLGFPDLERGEDLGLRQMPGYVLDLARHVPGVRRDLLEHGVTAVRSLGDEFAWVTELRRFIDEGELEGPRLFAAGPVLTTPGGHPVVTFGVDPDSDGVRVPRTPDEARRRVAELTDGRDAVDLIKVVQERGDERRRMEPFAPEVLAAIVDAAHDAGRRVTAHWGTLEDLTDVVAAGVDGLEHVEARGALDGWPDGVVADLVARDVTLTPTLAVTEVAISADDHRQLRRRVGEFHAAGGRVVAGSDAGIPGVPFGAGLHRELELLVDAGLAPVEALRAATSTAAAVLGSDDIGAVEPGRAADLVVLEGDPLGDIGAIRDVALVLRDGRLVVDHR